jgi:hypothetical protein
MNDNNSAKGRTSYEYIAQVKYMGDHTWMELDEQGDPIK